MTTVKISVVIAAALSAVACLRRGSAADRHRLLLLGVLSAGVMPWLVPLAPPWGSDMALALPSIHATEAGRRALWWLWLIGSAASCGPLAAGWVRVVWLGTRARRASSLAWAAVADDLIRELDVHRRVVLLESDRQAMPMTWGVITAKVLLPQSAREWSADRLRAVIAHELAHVRRGDWALHAAVDVITRIYWFNPLLWLARGRLRLESERACDDAVLGLGVNGADYASLLVEVARSAGGRRSAWASVPALARRRCLERRVAATLNDGVNRTPATPLAGAIVALAFLALAVGTAGFGAPDGPASMRVARVSDVERNIMLRLGGVDKRLAITARDVSFRKNRIAGRVELRARLGVDGSPTAVRIVEPAHPDLAMAAQAIVRQWRREPALVRGVPVEIPIRLTVDFQD
ncbi:MAG TPA: M56 family metallopeptidase [Vicinamibacterales bacterium]|jgi:TonB family protein|nr:M56 family metallopeptidase [Vicinamibacterales bacterium]